MMRVTLGYMGKACNINALRNSTDFTLCRACESNKNVRKTTEKKAESVKCRTEC